MKILNLYAGIGGNRKLWGDAHEVTAIEMDKEIANIYREFFPKDTVVVTDAHEYLLHNYMNFDLIWSSPPCQSHSSFRKNICVEFRGTEVKYPEMNLYQEIIFLQTHSKGKWVVENVSPYYDVLIKPTIKIGRHLFWSNFEIDKFDVPFSPKIREAQIPQLQEKHGFDLSKYKLKNKRQVLRNCVDYRIGLHILKCVLENKQNTL